MGKPQGVFVYRRDFSDETDTIQSGYTCVSEEKISKETLQEIFVVETAKDCLLRLGPFVPAGAMEWSKMYF